MEIRYGKKYQNKTSSYLLPCIIEGYDNIFSMKIKELFILGCGLKDMAIANNPDYDFEDTKPFYLLLDTVSVKRKSEDFLHWISYQPQYLYDYPMDLIGRGHMLILDFPNKYENAYNKFLKGKYSEMFTKGELEGLFLKSTEEYKVLTKDVSLLPKFTQRVREMFEMTNLKESDITNSELEFPYTINVEREFFNIELPQ